MKVLVTGASGFVGAHTTAELGRAGHEVRAFVRSAERLARSLDPLGASVSEVVVGDILDSQAVTDAVQGCQAVINAANVYTLDSTRRAEMDRVNVEGTESVLAAAVADGLDPVVHVSTYLTTLPADGPIPSDPPVGRPGNRPYASSKIAAEMIARRYQGQGAPVVTTYPGQVYGPHDPGGGEMVGITRLFLGSRLPPGLKGAIGIVDMGWLSRLHAALLEPGQGPRRVIAPGTTLSWIELGRALYEAAERPPPTFMPTPYWVALGTGQMAQALARRTGRKVPLNAEGPWISNHWRAGDDSEARSLAGDPPPLSETLKESIRWMADAGYLTPREAGGLASDRQR